MYNMNCALCDAPSRSCICCARFRWGWHRGCYGFCWRGRCGLRRGMHKCWRKDGGELSKGWAGRQDGRRRGNRVLTKRVDRELIIIGPSGRHGLRVAAGPKGFLSVWFGRYLHCRSHICEDKDDDYVSMGQEGDSKMIIYVYSYALSMVPPFWSTEVCYLPLGHYKPTNKREKKKQNLNWLPYPCIHKFNPISIILTSIYALIEQNSFRLCNIPRYFSWWLTTLHGFPFFVVIYFGSYRSKSFVAYYEKCAISYVDEFLVGFVCM
jgi:hypothetical protein